VTLSEDLRFRGLIYQVTDQALLHRLDTERLTVYCGFDPTAVSLGVGNLVQLCTLRRFELAGHRPIALAGGATGAIGDPGGKREERVLQSPEQLAENLAGLRRQLGRFITLEADGGPGVLVDNATWWHEMRVIEFLRDVGKHFTVNQMVAKESVKARFERPEQGISYTEFSYMLLQAYDFLHLFDHFGCRVQFGGSDQWGNITMGVELVRKLRRQEVFGLTTPLVTRADGQKFGKSEQGNVWLDPALTSPYRLYQFLLGTGDEAVGAYLRLFTFLDHQRIEALDEATKEHPERREAQRALAHEVCVLVHGDAETERAEVASAALFQGTVAALDQATLEEVVADAPSSTLGRGEVPGDGTMTLTEALVRSGLVASRGEARRAVSQGGIYLNDERQREADRALALTDLLHGRYLVLRRGRRQYHVLRAE
jgi:tyrosyl-tRNA synthetase